MALVIAASVLTGVAAADLLNGDFARTLRSWKAAWSARVEDGAAVLDDAGADPCFLFQAAPSEAGVRTLAFDFRSELAAAARQGVFRDTFFASVYFVDDPAAFVLENDQFRAAAGVLDLDAAGAYNVRGAVGPSTRGAGWQRFAGTFTNAHAVAVVVFELHNLNAISGDSRVRVDNVEWR